VKFGKISLFQRVLIAMSLGVALGYALPLCGVRCLKTFNVLFAQFLKFIVPILVLGLVIPAITDVGRNAGRMLLVIMGLSYASTVAAGFWGYGMSVVLFPQYLPTGVEALANVKEVVPYFSLKIPPLCDTLTALCLAFMTGIAIVRRGCDRLKGVCEDFGTVIKHTITHVVIPLIPLYILTMVAELAASGKIVALGASLLKVIATGVCLTVAYLVMLYAVAGIVTRRNPLKLLRTMLPAYLTGLSIASSTAVIPVTLECTERNGVSEDIAQLVVPLCANVHLVGAMIKVVMNSIAVMWLFGVPVDLMTFVQFVFMVGITAVAAPGVTGGTLMASLGLMDSILGLTPEQVSLVMTFYLAFDGYGPAANVTGDGAIALICERLFSRKQVRG